MKRTILAVTTTAALFGAFVCLPKVRGQNGAAPARGANSSPKSSSQSSAGQSSRGQSSPGRTSPGQTSPGQTSPGQTSMVQSSSGQASPPLKIACIDFEMILREYKKFTDKRQGLNAIAEGGNAKIQQISGEMQVVAKPLQDGTIDQESDEYTARTKKLYQLDNSRKACKAATERDMKMQSVKISVVVYQDLQAALKLFSEQNGYTLVVQIDREAAASDDYRLIQKTMGQQIFYYRSQEDITVAVLSYLNDRYEAERAEGGIEEEAAPISPGNEPTRSIPASPNKKPSKR